MRLPPDEAEHFTDLYSALIGWCARRRDRSSIIHGADSARAATLKDEAAARDRVFDVPSLIDAYVAENPDHLLSPELGLVRAWRWFVRGDFVVERDLRRYSVFIDWKDPPAAYGVVYLQQELADIVPVSLPILVEAVLLPWRGAIVCDGIFRFRHFHTGRAIRRRLADTYRAAKASGIITMLEFGPAKHARPGQARDIDPVPGQAITIEHLESLAGLRRTARDAILQRQPATVAEALAIPYVGRRVTGHLLALGLISDPEGKQRRS